MWFIDWDRSREMEYSPFRHAQSWDSVWLTDWDRSRDMEYLPFRHAHSLEIQCDRLINWWRQSEIEYSVTAPLLLYGFVQFGKSVRFIITPSNVLIDLEKLIELLFFRIFDLQWKEIYGKLSDVQIHVTCSKVWYFLMR